MATNASGREYKVAVGLHGSNFGEATVAGTMYNMRLDTVNDIDFKMSTGNIANGTIRLYGIN